MSVLVDNKQMASNGKPYDFKAVNSKEEAAKIVKDNPNLICMLNGSPVLTEGQEGEAIEFMRGLMRAKYTLKEVDKGGTNRYDVAPIKTVKEAQEWQVNNAKEAQEVQLLLEPIIELYNAKTPEEIEKAILYWKGGTVIKDVERTPKGIKIYYKNPDAPTTTIPFYSSSTNKAFGNREFLKTALPAFYKDDATVRLINKNLNYILPLLPYYENPNTTLLNEPSQQYDQIIGEDIMGVNVEYSGGIRYTGPGSGVLLPENKPGQGGKVDYSQLGKKKQKQDERTSN
jgi:hypothetical protein